MRESKGIEESSQESLKIRWQSLSQGKTRTGRAGEGAGSRFFIDWKQRWWLFIFPPPKWVIPKHWWVLYQPQDDQAAVKYSPSSESSSYRSQSPEKAQMPHKETQISIQKWGKLRCSSPEAEKFSAFPKQRRFQLLLVLPHEIQHWSQLISQNKCQESLLGPTDSWVTSLYLWAIFGACMIIFTQQEIPHSPGMCLIEF